MRVPIPITIEPNQTRLPIATAASAWADRWPTITVSTTPMSMRPTWTATIGSARRSSALLS